MNAPATRRAVFSCSFCSTALIKRTSVLQHPHLRTDAFMCPNPLCGATYTGTSELTGIASPTGIPNAPPCELPPTPGYERSLLQQRWKEERGDTQLDWIDGMNMEPCDGGPPPHP